MQLAIEGIDGSGKGAQTRLLVEQWRVCLTLISFPQFGQTSSSNPITGYLYGQCAVIYQV